MMKKRCASDISKKKFEEIRLLLQSVRRRTKPATIDLYEVFCALLYLLRTGCQWKSLHSEFAEVAYRPLVLCQVECVLLGRYQRSGASFKKIRLARPAKNYGAMPAARF